MKQISPPAVKSSRIMLTSRLRRLKRKHLSSGLGGLKRFWSRVPAALPVATQGVGTRTMTS